ncbi:MAG: hypothetical protein J0L79_03755 [Rickettsiales bacterium]|nr:hypothetical protein [Rickettsiales bacterium]MCA0254147.1 DUF3971 domain-containing protein [Pseudomonadota bacterium]
MKLFAKISAFVIIPIAICVMLLALIYYGQLNGAVQKFLEYRFKVEFKNFEFKDATLTSQQLVIKKSNSITKIENLKLEFDFSLDGLTIVANPTKMIVENNDNESIITSDFYGKLITNQLGALVFSEFFFDKVEFPGAPKSLYSTGDNKGMMHFKNEVINGANRYQINLQFDEKKSYLSIRNEDTGQKLKIDAKNVPLISYMIFDKFMPDNPLIDFFQEFIKNGHISEAELFVDLEKEIMTKDSIVGQVKVVDLYFSYNPGLPMLTKVDLDINILAPKIEFVINKAFSSEIELQGNINLDWVGRDNSILEVVAKGYGPASSLTDFIHQSKHDVLKEAKIDLRKIKGDVEADVLIKIPLKPGTKDIYNISAKIENVSLPIFENYVKWTSGKVSGQYTGDKLKLEGDGKINNFDSELSFLMNFDNETEFSHKLDIKTDINLGKNKTKKIAFLTLLGGKSTVDFTYLNKNSKGQIIVDTDISNLDLYFDKLGIRKKSNDPSHLIVNGEFTSPTKVEVSFLVNSNSGIKTSGKVDIDKDRAVAHINEIKSKETRLSAKIIMNAKLFDAQIRGKVLDLSEANMLQFLEKERDTGTTRLKLNVEKVKLKDDIWLTNMTGEFECDHIRCFKGSLNSNIGSRSVNVDLQANDNQEKWSIKCTNAGALLRGLDMYNSMRAGNLTLDMVTSRKEIKPGYIIPIHQGNFVFDRFVLHNAKMLTRLVSLISLPGLLDLMTGKSDITFQKMSGNFSFRNGVLSVEDSYASGPYFDFSLKGVIDTKSKMMDINGHVNPKLYGVGSVIGSIPIISRIFIGDKKHQGLVSKSYRLHEKY